MARKCVRVVQLISDQLQGRGVERKLKFAVRLLQIYVRDILKSFAREEKTFALEGDDREGRGGGGGRSFVDSAEKEFDIKLLEKQFNMISEPKALWRDVARCIVNRADFDVNLKFLVMGSLDCDGGTAR